MQLAGGASSGGLRLSGVCPFPFDQNGLATSEVDVGGRQITDALVATSVVVVGDEGLDVGFEIARQIIVLEQDAVFQGLMRYYEVIGMAKTCHDMRDLRNKLAHHYGRQLHQFTFALPIPEVKPQS